MKRIAQATATILCPHCDTPCRYTNGDIMAGKAQEGDSKAAKKYYIFCPTCHEQLQVKKIE